MKFITENEKIYCTENGRSVAERVIECFYTTSPDIGVSLTYDIKKLSGPSEAPEE